jgi:hypothetical protein
LPERSCQFKLIGLKKLFDWTGLGRLLPFGLPLFGFGEVFDDLKAGFVGWAEDIGAKIGQAIKDAIKNLVAGTSLQSMFEPLPVAFAGPPSNLANTMPVTRNTKGDVAETDLS